MHYYCIKIFLEYIMEHRKLYKTKQYPKIPSLTQLRCGCHSKFLSIYLYFYLFFGLWLILATEISKINPKTKPRTGAKHDCGLR